MPTYDTTFIINSQTDDASIDRDVRSVADLIKSNGGKILAEDRLGTRRLAYDLKGLSQGYYASFIYEAPPTVPKLLDRHFHLGESYLRHLTILFEGQIKSDEEEVETATAGRHPAKGPGPKEPREKPEEERPAEPESTEVTVSSEPGEGATAGEPKAETAAAPAPAAPEEPGEDEEESEPFQAGAEPEDERPTYAEQEDEEL